MEIKDGVPVAEENRIAEAPNDGVRLTAEAEEVGRTKPKCYKCRYRRYYIAVMAFVGYLMSYANRVNISVAIVFMTQKSNKTYSNGTVYVHQEFSWDATTQGNILASFFYGYIVTQIPGGYLAGRIGGNHVLNIGVLGSGITSLFVPWAAKFQVHVLVAIRVICGLFQGIIIPSMSDVWSFWAPPLERTVLGNIALCGNFLSSIMLMPLGSVIGRTIGWEWIFYFSALFTALWSVVWGLTVFRRPRDDWYVTEEEQKYVERAVGDPVGAPKPPWCRIFISLPVAAIVIAFLGHNVGYFTVLTLGPKYFADALKQSIALSSFYVGLGSMIEGVLMMVCSVITDTLLRRKVLSRIATRRTVAGIGFSLQCVMFTVAAVSKTPAVIISCIVLGVGLGGIGASGLLVNALEIGARHAPIIVGFANTVGCLPVIIMPFLMPENNKESSKACICDWQHMWFICAAGYFITLVLNLSLMRVNRQSWV